MYSCAAEFALWMKMLQVGLDDESRRVATTAVYCNKMKQKSSCALKIKNE